MEWKRAAEKECGVICGCNAAQEWLLPWWWERYSLHNSFPVTFIDFGMTDRARAFCKERGELISLSCDTAFIKSKEQIHPDLAAAWEAHYGTTIWEARLGWFMKPFALLHSPYKCSVWLDLDCEVLTSIAPLFSYAELALFKEEEGLYNGGVIVFAHGIEIISRWAEEALHSTQDIAQDDMLLSALIRKHRVEVVELPEVYNWRIMRGLNLQARIFHWVGKKNYIKAFGGIKPALDVFEKRCRGENAQYM